MSFIDMIHLFVGIGIGLLFGLAGGVVLARMDDIWKLEQMYLVVIGMDLIGV